ncbi:MAG: carboxylating nicotinate-nucleotide diphosphorylase [Candidatus Korarchaeum sp.]|nr:carboxylating nicotinate-nucleotide diphosphorylase [Candidatus Korarchaeum sp.]
MIEEFYVRRLLDFLEEDVFPEDLTSRFLKGAEGRGLVLYKDGERGVLAGVRFIEPFLRHLGFEVSVNKSDGEAISKGDLILVLKGHADKLLAVERLVLNLIARLSGVATATNSMVRLARSVNPHVRIAGTRKTTPGLRVFEKYAIEIGGGDPHRFNLSDAVLIKDNHIAIYGDLERLIKAVKSGVSFTKRIQVEVSTYEDAIKAYRAGADALLLDNMNLSEIERVVSELRGNLIVEVSGGITPNNVVYYARTGVDIISSGYITHSARWLDFSMDAERT